MFKMVYYISNGHYCRSTASKIIKIYRINNKIKDERKFWNSITKIISVIYCNLVGPLITNYLPNIHKHEETEILN